MRPLKTLIHPSINIEQGSQFTRITARAIAMHKYSNKKRVRPI